MTVDYIIIRSVNPEIKSPVILFVKILLYRQYCFVSFSLLLSSQEHKQRSAYYRKPSDDPDGDRDGLA